MATQRPGTGSEAPMPGSSFVGSGIRFAGETSIGKAVDVAGSTVVAPVPKPSPIFKIPTNAAQNPLINVPKGYTQRIMKPTQQVSRWVLGIRKATNKWRLAKS